MTGLIARRDEQIRQLIDDIATISTAFVDAEDILDEALAEFPQFTEAVDRLLTARGAELGNTVSRLTDVTGVLRDRSEDVGRVIEVMPVGLREVFQVTRRGDYAWVNVPCVATQAPPCPTPVLLQDEPSRAQRLDSTTAFERLLLGGAP